MVCLDLWDHTEWIKALHEIYMKDDWDQKSQGVMVAAQTKGGKDVTREEVCQNRRLPHYPFENSP